MSKSERRFIPVEQCELDLEERGTDKLPKITGYAAVFYVPEDVGTEYKLFDNLVERIMPRAFNRALREKDNAAALFNHDPNQLLGRVASKTLRLSKDQRGLKYEVDPPDTSVGRDVVENIRRGDVTGSSFSFAVTDQKFVTDTRDDGTSVDVREIHGVQLYDVAPVVFPAYGGTSTAVRAAASDMTEVRSAYEAWKNEQAGSLNAEKRAAEEQESIAAKNAERKQRAESLEA